MNGRFNFNKLILDLCGGSGSWAAPYREAGYNVRLVDLKFTGQDVRLFIPPHNKVYGVLAAPDCTHLAGSGARWWEEKGENALLHALSIADACLRIAIMTRPKFWAIENPVGRLRRFWGEPRLIFNPCDYGDPYTKRTLVWGEFNLPEPYPVEPVEGSKMHLIPPGPNRQYERSITPAGFARRFFEANQ